MKKQILIGLLIGVFSFFIFASLIYYKTNPNLHFKEYFTFVVKGKMAVPFLTISLIPNLLYFFIFIKLNKDEISKGVLLATFICGLFVTYMKFFG